MVVYFGSPDWEVFWYVIYYECPERTQFLYGLESLGIIVNEHGKYYFRIKEPYIATVHGIFYII